MKKKLSIILLLIVLTLSLCGCEVFDFGNFNKGETPHRHVFDQKVAKPQYWKRGATCVEKAVYYKSCSCGERGDTTFEYGDFAQHSFGEGSRYRYCTYCHTYFVATEDELWAVVGASVDFAGQTIKLTDDITLTDDWYPICPGSRDGSSAVGTAFAGTFDGDGHTIYNLDFDSSASGALGFIGICNGLVKNLTIANSQISKPTCKELGFVVGLLVEGGSVINCTVADDCSLVGKDGTGAIAGRILIEGSILGCTNNANVSLADKSLAGVGGIVGKAYYSAVGKSISISDCTNNGKITGNIAGGIVGLCAGDVSNCINNGEIVSYGNGGGIVGQQTTCGSISGCRNNGLVTLTKVDASSSKYSAGGIVGYIGYSKDATSYGKQQTVVVNGNLNMGNINASKADFGAGGIIGLVENHLVAKQNVNACLAIIGSQYAGGIVGSASINGSSAINNDGMIVQYSSYWCKTALTANVKADVVSGGLENCEVSETTELPEELLSFED